MGTTTSEASQRALARAIELAKAFGAGLLVTSVAPMLEAAGRSAGLLDPTDMPERHRAELEEAEKQAADAGVATRLVLAVGTRELGFYQRLLGQSTSQAVAHHARCDVLIAH